LRAGFGKPKKLALLERGKAPHGGDVCVVCCALIYILIPTQKTYGLEVFVPARTLLAVFLLRKGGILCNAESRWHKKPWLIISVHTNGTITVQRGNEIDRMNIRRVKPFEEDLDNE
jgi:hypothetical protein